ncbi:MAG: SDR family NAD(P)-dependent oxidoreductase [Gammaproteobacteria bacterium]
MHALVTGAGAGLGRETVRALAAAGAKVTLTGRDAAALANVAAEIGAATGNGRLDCLEFIKIFKRYEPKSFYLLCLLVNIELVFIKIKWFFSKGYFNLFQGFYFVVDRYYLVRMIKSTLLINICSVDVA